MRALGAHGAPGPGGKEHLQFGAPWDPKFGIFLPTGPPKIYREFLGTQYHTPPHGHMGDLRCPRILINVGIRNLGSAHHRGGLTRICEGPMGPPWVPRGAHGFSIKSGFKPGLGWFCGRIRNLREKSCRSVASNHDLVKI